MRLMTTATLQVARQSNHSLSSSVTRNCFQGDVSICTASAAVPQVSLSSIVINAWCAAAGTCPLSSRAVLEAMRCVSSPALRWQGPEAPASLILSACRQADCYLG